MIEEPVIRLSQYVDHPPERVWAALTQPELLARWWAPGDIRPEVGHSFTLDMGKWGLQPCTVLEVEPLRFIAYSFGDMTVSWRIEAEGRGTRLSLEHSGFDMDSPLGRMAFEMMGKGWPAVLARIAPALSGAAPPSSCA